MTGSPRVLITPGEKMKCVSFFFFFSLNAELTCVSKVKRPEERVVMFGSYSGVGWVQKNAVCAKQLVHLVLQVFLHLHDELGWFGGACPFH